MEPGKESLLIDAKGSAMTQPMRVSPPDTARLTEPPFRRGSGLLNLIVRVLEGNPEGALFKASFVRGWETVLNACDMTGRAALNDLRQDVSALFPDYPPVWHVEQAEAEAKPAGEFGNVTLRSRELAVLERVE